MTLAPGAVEKAAAFLRAAKAARRVEPNLPEDCRPGGEADAVAIADAILRAESGPVAGWKVGGGDPAARARMGVSEPFVGMIPGGAVHRAPATLPYGERMRPAVEAEYAFRLAKDLPARDKPYAREEVEAAVGELIAGIEVPEFRLGDDTGLGMLAAIADHGAVGCYALGPATADWRGLDLVGQTVTMTIDGVEKGRGTGQLIMGHPAESLTWFVNHMSRKGRTVKAGEFVSTGTLTGMVRVPSGAKAVADFGPLGRIELAFPG